MTKEYIGTLRVDGKKQAEVSCSNKEMVVDIIFHYFLQYKDEGDNFSVTIKCKEMKEEVNHE